MKLICLDAEFADAREILELAIYDYDGNPVYCSLFKPEFVRQWRSSQRIHHISPAMVKDKPSFASCRDDIQEIVDNVDYIVGFAVDNDVRMLEKSGIEHMGERVIVDVRDIYWHCVAKAKDVSLNSVPGLAACAADLGVSFGEDREHSAGGDTLVTLRCLRRMIESEPDGVTDPETVLKRMIQETDIDKRAFRRENAKGYVHLLKSPKGYTFKTSTHATLSRDDVVATVRVDHRDRAEVELYQHFSKKATSSDRHVFALRDRDIAFFQSYTNTYDEENADIYRMYAKRY